MKTRPLIVLLTDFGLKDGSVAAMKGVIKTICPEADTVDMSHDVPAFNVLIAGLILNTHYAYFPKGTVFICVVDPGVGTDRAPIAIKAKGYTFIGPNNGIFGQAIPFSEYKDVEKMVVLENKKYFLPDVSDTFHGRDIFSPVAAHIAKGIPLEKLGPTKNPKCFLTQLALPTRIELQGNKTRLYGKVVYIDDFGNLVTSINKRMFEEKIGYQPVEVFIGAKRWARNIQRTFADGKKNEVITLFGGDFGDLMTLSVNMGSAQKITRAKEGDEVCLAPITPPRGR